MADFVLIHGGAHGPWCWERVIPYLEASDSVDKVIAIDLLADAQAVVDKAMQDILIADYVAGVVHRALKAELSHVILVGHSMAGVIVPAVAHRLRERILRVIYLTTSNPPVGHSIADLMKNPLSPLSRNVGFNEMFCSDLDEETSAWLLRNLRDEPPLPFQEKAVFCALPDGVPSTYIVCENDMALPVAFQLQQASNVGVDEVVSLDSGHSAFASRPKDLADLLLRYA